MRKIILMSGIFTGFLMLTMALSAGPVSAAGEEELMPMELDGTQWDVEVISIDKKGNKTTEPDALIFKDGKFVSQAYQDKGYEPTNYSLTIDEEEITRFGTMQIKEKETSFWKGKVVKKTIDGSVHIQYSNGKNETRYYSGKLSSGSLKRQKRSKPAVVPPPPPAPQAEKPKEEGKNIIGEVMGKIMGDSKKEPAQMEPQETPQVQEAQEPAQMEPQETPQVQEAQEPASMEEKK